MHINNNDRRKYKITRKHKIVTKALWLMNSSGRKIGWPMYDTLTPKTMKCTKYEPLVVRMKLCIVNSVLFIVDGFHVLQISTNVTQTLAEMELPV